MNIYVVTGGRNVPIDYLKNEYKDFIDEPKFRDVAGLSLTFPECPDVQHPAILFDTIKKFAKDCIEENCNLFILTYNDHVFNAIRCAIKETSFKGAMCLFLKEEYTNFIVCNIDECGKLDNWEVGMFDTWENALTALLD